MVRELFKLAEHAQRQQPKPPGTGRAAQWYFFGVAAFWVYLRFIQNQLTVEVTSNARLAHLFGWVLKKHTIIAFSLYTAGAARGGGARHRGRPARAERCVGDCVHGGHAARQRVAPGAAHRPPRRRRRWVPPRAAPGHVPCCGRGPRGGRAACCLAQSGPKAWRWGRQPVEHARSLNVTAWCARSVAS